VAIGNPEAHGGDVGSSHESLGQAFGVYFRAGWEYNLFQSLVREQAVTSVNGNWREFADSKRFHRALQIGRSAFSSPRSAARSRSSGSEKDSPVHSGRRSKQEGFWAVFLSTAPLLYPLKGGWRCGHYNSLSPLIQ